MAPVTTELKVLVKAVGKGELKELEAALNKLAVTAKTKVDTNFKKVSLELKKVQRTSAQSISNLRGYRNAWRDIAEQVDVTSREFQVATRNAEKLDAQLEKIQQTSRTRISGGARLRAGAQVAGTVAGAGVFGGPEGAAGALIGSIGGVQGAIIGGALGAQVGQLRKAAAGVGEYVAQLNLAKATLGGVSTDLVDYNKNLEFARRISGDYGLALQGVIKSFAGVTAAARANNLSTEQTQKIFEGMTASGIAFGKSQEDLQAIFLATVQVLSKGKASAEEISGQIGERIPGAVAKFAEATKRTLPELAKAFKDGEVTIADFVLFAEKQGDDYAEFAKSLASGPEKAGIRLEIALDKMKEAYGGLFLGINAALSDSLTALVNYVNGNKEQFQKLLAETAAFTEGVINLTVNSVAAIMTILDPVIKAVKFIIKGLVEFDGMPFVGPTQLEKDILKEQYGERPQGQLSPEAQKFMDMMKDFLPSQFASAFTPSLPALDRPDTGISSGRAGGGRTRAPMSQFEFELEQRILDAREQGLDYAQRIAEFDLKIFEINTKLVDDPLKQLVEFRKAEIKLNQQLLKIDESKVKSAEKYEQSIVDAGKSMGENLAKMIPETNKLKDLWKSIGESISSGVAGAIEGAIFEAKSLQESLSGILRSVASLLIQFGTKSLFSSIGFANGGIMTGQGPLDLKTYARGGIARSPQLAMFGEGSMPEAYVPLPDGRSIPVTMRGGGVGNVVVNVDAKGTQVQGDNDRSRQLGGAISAAVQAELIRQRRPGGLLAS